MLDKYSKRESNWELLRILAMLAIISGHFVGQSEALKVVFGIDYIWAMYIGSASRISVSLFLLLGCWYMVDCNMNGKRILMLYGQVLFYTMSITIIILLLGYNLNKSILVTIVQAILPFSQRVIWFASSYIALMLLSPYLKKILSLTRLQLKKLLSILSFLILYINFLQTYLSDTWMCTLVWFIYIYIYGQVITKSMFIRN